MLNVQATPDPLGLNGEQKVPGLPLLALAQEGGPPFVIIDLFSVLPKVFQHALYHLCHTEGSPRIGSHSLRGTNHCLSGQERLVLGFPPHPWSPAQSHFSLLLFTSSQGFPPGAQTHEFSEFRIV